MEATIVTPTWPPWGPPPRIARFRRGTLLVGTIVPVVTFVLATSIWWFEQRAVVAMQEIVDAGVETNGRVIGRRTTWRRRGQNYLVTCRYVADGRAYTREFVTSQRIFDQAPNGPTMILSYAVRDPSLSWLGTRTAIAEDLARLRSAMWWGPGMLAAFGALFTWLYWRRAHLLLSLARDGVVRWGTVTDVRRVKYQSRLTVAVDDGLGTAVRKGPAGAESPRFQPGSPAAVLSHPSNPAVVRIAGEIADQITIETTGPT